MRFLPWLVALASSGCVHDDLVPCGDIVCPNGHRCDVERDICIDPAGLSVPANMIDLSGVPCGASTAQVISIRNFGDRSIQYTAVTTLDSIEVIPASGEFPVDATVDLQIVGTARVPSTPGSPLEGTVLIATDVEVIERSVRMTTAGAVPTASVQQLDFGEGTVGVSDTRSFMLHNVGNAAVTVDLAIGPTSSEFVLQSAPSIQLGASQATSVDVQFAPLSLSSFASTVGLTFTGNLCAPAPATVSLSGLATTDQILVDSLALDFGVAACGAPAAMLPLKVTNNTPLEQPLTTSIQGTETTLFSFVGASSVPANGNTTLTTSRKVVPTTTSVGIKSATLVIEAPNATKMVTLKQQIQAPVLAATDTYHDFGSLPTNVLVSYQFMVHNAGNANAAVTVSPAGINLPGGGRITISPTTLQIAPNGSAPINVSVATGTQGGFGLLDGTITVLAPGMCSDPLHLTFDVNVD